MEEESHSLIFTGDFHSQRYFHYCRDCIVRQAMVNGDNTSSYGSKERSHQILSISSENFLEISISPGKRVVKGYPNNPFPLTLGISKRNGIPKVKQSLDLCAV